MPDNTILTVSLNPAIDRAIEVPALVIGGHARGRQLLRQPAGKAVNVSRALARLGRPSLAMGFLGQHERAEYEAFLHEAGGGKIACDWLSVPGRTRENITLIDPILRTDTHIRDSGFEVTSADVSRLGAKLIERVQASNLVVFAGSLPPGMSAAHLAALVRGVAGQGGRVVLDIAGDVLREVLVLGLPPLWLVKPNRTELAQVVGADTLADPKLLLSAARQVGRSCAWVVATLGEEGALLLGPEQVLRGRVDQPPTLVIDTVGCGDCMLAGLLDGQLAGAGPEGVLRRGLALATANTRMAGAANFDVGLVGELERAAVVEKLA